MSVLKLPIPRRARWAVPAGVVAVVMVAATASAITIAQAAPALPPRTPAQLLAAVAGQTAPPPALTGTVVETAQLGIPELPGQYDPTSITSLLTGSHTIRVWYAGPRHVRLAVPVPMGETDLIRNGSTVWLWQSSSDSVTRVKLPPGRGMAREPKSPLTPQQAAREALAALGPTTRVTAQSNVTVAGQAAYQLVLAPRDSRSLIGKVTIAVDGQHLGVPLRVQVFARGATSPALSVGYTSISFVRPAAANFSFTPPKGAHVHTVAPMAAPGWYAYAPLSGHRLVPPGWSGYAPLGGPKLTPLKHGWGGVPPPGMQVPVHLGKLPARIRAQVLVPRLFTGGPHGLPPAIACRLAAGVQRSPAWAKVKSAHPLLLPSSCLRLIRARGVLRQAAGVPYGAVAPAPPQVIGKGWLTVAVLPESALAGLAAGGNAQIAVGQAARSVAGGSGPVDSGAVLGALLGAGTPVHGRWGSGKLIHTSLISILVMSNGRVLVGAVAPSVLYADAAHVK